MSAPDDTGFDGLDRRTLVAEYVLGLLDEPLHGRVAHLIESDARLQAERDFWQSRFSALNREYEETPVPPRLLTSIENRLFGAPQTAVGWWHSLAFWRSLATGAVAVAVIATGFALVEPRTDVSILTTQLVAALEEEGSDVRFLALYDGTGNVRLTALSGDTAPDRDFELWAIQGGNNPVSMGVIPASGKTAVPVTADVLSGLGEGSVLAITLEQKGGSRDGNPHGPIVAKGAVTAI